VGRTSKDARRTWKDCGRELKGCQKGSKPVGGTSKDAGRTLKANGRDGCTIVNVESEILVLSGWGWYIFKQAIKMQATQSGTVHSE
jgi:hypothetical protein